MDTDIVRKIVFIAAGVLVLVQFLVYAAVRIDNVNKAENERAGLAQEVEILSVTKSELQEYLGLLQKEYDEMAASVPERILTGYDDHEVLLAGFLDYLNAPELERVAATVTMQGTWKYIENPVPLFEHDLSIIFSFTDLTDARKMLSRILEQDRFPLAVRNFELRNSGQKIITGSMKISLLIPARQGKQLSGMKEVQR